MPSERKYSFWPALVITCLAVVAPLTIGSIEMRIARNARAETSAIDHLHSVAKAEAAYHAAAGEYPATLDALSGLPSADDNYEYTYRKLSNSAYTVSGTPRQPGKHGNRFFYLDQSGAVRYEVGRPAASTSPEVPTPNETAK